MPKQSVRPVTPPNTKDARQAVREYIIENLFLGAGGDLGDDASLLEAGALDSTAALELVAFLEETCGIKVEDDEIAPENLETINRICAFIERKSALVPAE